MKTNNTQKTIIGAIILFAASKMYSKSKSVSFLPVNDNNTQRNCDAFGCGYFGASRGERDHKGIDFVVTPNQNIKAPFDCEITRYGFPYIDDQDQKLIVIQGLKNYAEYYAKIMYINPVHQIGEKFKKGEVLCTAGDISSKYGSGMTPHVHFELYKNGVLVDPTPFFN